MTHSIDVFFSSGSPYAYPAALELLKSSDYGGAGVPLRQRDLGLSKP
jgi:2-hydroxychromene-2-carboxylate isomerase